MAARFAQLWIQFYAKISNSFGPAWSMRSGGMNTNWSRLVAAVGRGELVIYPTETFYALGCLATCTEAVTRVAALKDRPKGKPLPLILADWDMAAKFTGLDAASLNLAQYFWPGPLSIVTTVAPEISPLVKDTHGRAAVRISPHPVATSLCHAVGAPLISTSANKSGQPPAACPDDLDSSLTVRALVLDALPWPGGEQPSTLVQVLGPKEVHILRSGRLGPQDFAAHGYRVVEQYKKFTPKGGETRLV